MFFSKYIKNKPVYNRIAIALINGILSFLKIIKPINRNVTDNIVIIALHKLGDSVFTIQAVKNILHYHKKNIFLICFTETLPIFKIVFNSINFIELNHNDFSFTHRIAKRNARKILRKINPSTIYDLTGTIFSASLLFNCSSKEIVGVNEPYYRSLYTKYSSIRKEPHITDVYLDAIRPLIPIHHYDYVIKNNDLNEYILIHPFAGTPPKEWGLKKFFHLAQFLNEKFECVIITPPNKIPNDVLTEMKAGNVRFIETKSTIELIEVIKKCLILIGNDSGPLHIANLLGKPTFTIYGPTNPDYHKPLNGTNKYIFRKIPCSPGHNEKLCFTHGGVLGCPSFECMNTLTLNEVKESVNEFINSLKKQNIGVTV